MEQEQCKKYWFFGSKLNTVLLLVLIILMVIALKWMYQNKEIYLPMRDHQQLNNRVSVESFEINQKVKTDFGLITIPNGWKATQGCYKSSYTISPESVPSAPDISAPEADDLCNNYVSIVQDETCKTAGSGYYCKNTKFGALGTINPKFRSIVDSLYLELK